jgi:glutaminyl-tRNA synthetase
MSKRKLLQLVNENHVDGWDDPRMPTLSGLRRRGIPPEAIVSFCERIGVSKRDGIVDISLFEHTVRERLNEVAPRYMGVLRPLEVVIDNYPEDQEDEFEAPLHPEDPSYGTRKIPFAKVLYIERDDFRMSAPKKWFRLAPGKEVRLRYACLLTCNEVETDEAGEVVRLRCTWDPASRGGKSPDGRKVKGTLHWVSAKHAVPADVRLYDRLFTEANPQKDGADFRQFLNPNSREVVTGCMLERALGEYQGERAFQLERLGYFCLDRDSSSRPGDRADSRPGALVLNRTIELRDTWAKIEKQLGSS